MKLSKSVSIVTGGTSGIGLAIVKSLAKHGGNVAFCGRTDARVTETVNQLRADGLTNVLGLPCNVGNAASVRKFVDDVRDTYGQIDILVNNAGLSHFGQITELTDTQIQEILDVNVSGVFHATRAVLDDMLSRKSGAVINIASLAGKNGVAGGTAYAASKHAVMGFSKSLMLEVRKHGVRVVAICPGSVETPFFDSAGWELKNPDRVLQPSDVADAVIAALTLPERALISELDIRPASP